MRNASTVAVLTGAGISQESGIATFRGKGGVWEKYDFSKLATLEGFLTDPGLVWQWYDDRRQDIKSTGPNPAHETIAIMENYYPAFKVVTQNIDGLHEQAGNTSVIEMHGNIWRIKCMEGDSHETNLDVPLEPLPPVCKKCGGVMRPDVVWFGEALDTAILSASIQAAQECDLMYVVGTSAIVYPAAAVPQYAKQYGAYVVEVNLEPTPLSGLVDRSYRGKAGEVMPELWAAVMDGRE